MNIAFFQNCISPHQMPYIEALSQRNEVGKVYVIAPRVTYGMRKDLGWPESWTESGEKLEVKINPEDSEVEAILKEINVAMFSGIIAFTEVQHWLDLSLSYTIKRGVITEAPFTYGGKPLWLHWLRFWIKGRRYILHIEWIFAIGETCAKYYASISKKWKIVPFMYSTAMPDYKPVEVTGDRMKVLFVGALEPRKNVESLLKTTNMLKDKVIVTIAGGGDELDKLKQISEKAEFLGTIPMNKVSELMSQNDVLVLPSWHDGWGAVINEARLVGTIAVSTKECGAKVIADYSYKSGDVQALAEILENIYNNLDQIRKARDLRRVEAGQKISPAAIADRMYKSML